MPTFTTNTGRWGRFWGHYVMGMYLLIAGYQFWQGDDFIVGHFWLSRSFSALVLLGGVTQLLMALGVYFTIKESKTDV